MIVEFGGENIFSFKDEFSIKLNDTYNDNNVFMIKGANASGKTNIFKIINFLYHFCLNSFTSKDFELKFGIKSESQYGIVPFIYDSEKPIKLYVIFQNVNSNEKYRYNLELLNNEIMKEEIKSINQKGLCKTVVLRNKNEIDKSLKSVHQILNSLIMNSDVSIISSMLAKKRIDNTFKSELFDSIITSFEQITIFLTLKNKEQPFQLLLLDAASQVLHTNKELFQATIEAIKKYDTQIIDIEIKEKRISDTQTQLMPFFKHKHQDKEFITDMSTISEGTRVLYNIWMHIYMSLQSGKIIFADELFNTLHTDIIVDIIKVFKNPETNPSSAKLVFSLHRNDSEIYELFDKSNIFFVEKEDNESYIFRLDELKSDKIRNGRSIEMAYINRKIGGRPNIDVN